MKFPSATRYINGIEIIRERATRKLWMRKSKYVNFVLERFKIKTCRPLVILVLQRMKISMEDYPKYPFEMEDISSVPYTSIFGSLIYAMDCMRLDIFQTMGVLSFYMANPSRVHWDEVKRVFKYLRGNFEYSLCFNGYPFGYHHLVCICGYVDLDWEGNINSRRSANGYFFSMFGSAISWTTKQ